VLQPQGQAQPMQGFVPMTSYPQQGAMQTGLPMTSYPQQGAMQTGLPMTSYPQQAAMQPGFRHTHPSLNNWNNWGQGFATYAPQTQHLMAY
jgi:hypothetical protein